MMSFWIYFFAAVLIFTLSYCIGNYLEKNPPRTMDEVFGYKTELSSKNQSTWDFAQVCAGRICRIISIAAFVLALILIISFKIANSRLMFNICSILVLGAQLLSVSLTFPATEYMLVKNFHEDGTRKKPKDKNKINSQENVYEKLSVQIFRKLREIAAAFVSSVRILAADIRKRQIARKDQTVHTIPSQQDSQREKNSSSGPEDPGK